MAAAVEVLIQCLEILKTFDLESICLHNGFLKILSVIILFPSGNRQISNIHAISQAV